MPNERTVRVTNRDEILAGAIYRHRVIEVYEMRPVLIASGAFLTPNAIAEFCRAHGVAIPEEADGTP
jgi:hypothetical protein